nr:unnamed protein product [Digitaria exilis]
MRRARVRRADLGFPAASRGPAAGVRAAEAPPSCRCHSQRRIPAQERQESKAAASAPVSPDRSSRCAAGGTGDGRQGPTTPGSSARSWLQWISGVVLW